MSMNGGFAPDSTFNFANLAAKLSDRFCLHYALTAVTADPTGTTGTGMRRITIPVVHNLTKDWN